MKSLLICAAVASLATPAASLAASAWDDHAPSVKVSFQDLDINKPHDAKLLLRRIDDAATESCGADLWSDPMLRQEVRASPCHQETVNRAVSQLNAPTVTAVYESYARVASTAY